MLVHTVLFWLRKDLDREQVAAFREGLASLSAIESAEAVYIGTPAATPERPVIDTSYDFCLTVILKDLEAHDAYQAHPRHSEFLARFKESWERVSIIDAD